MEFRAYLWLVETAIGAKTLVEMMELDGALLAAPEDELLGRLGSAEELGADPAEELLAWPGWFGGAGELVGPPTAELLPTLSGAGELVVAPAAELVATLAGGEEPSAPADELLAWPG